MRCPSCHHDNRSDRRFCTQCGTELAKGCPSCGALIEVGEKFCGGCGAALTIGGRTTTPSPEHASLLAEKIRQAKATVEGERKQVTVLFVDVRGSMKLAEQLDPEAWSQIMQRFFRIFCDGIERFEGFVDKFTGDGGMALFGAPIAHEDQAQRACYAALHLRDAARTYASEVRAQHGMPFAVRIGLNSGEVVVGRIGDDLRMEFTAQGHVVGLAQRMEALAEPGHICLSEHTARLVEGYFQLQDLGRITVKGVSEPVGLFDLEAVGSFRTRFDRSRARGLSAFVGRDREMAVLDAALERARSGSGQVVGVVAEAGTGKSRLCAEFVESCSDDLQVIGEVGLREGPDAVVMRFRTAHHSLVPPVLDVPTLVMHGDDDQIVPIADSALLSAKLLKKGRLKVYEKFPHGMCTTHADVVNTDLLAFIMS